MKTVVDQARSRPEARTFLNDGGEMGRLTRAYDWAESPIGAPETWPQGLRTAVRLMLTSRHPMFIWWGPDLIQFYNDAYRETMGPERHPSALGDRGRDCWAEIWDIIGPQIDTVMRGEGSTWHVDQLVPVTRNGSREDVWWTYGYSPIESEGAVGGVLVVCSDVTAEHLAKAALVAANLALGTEMARLRDIFRQAPGFVAVLKGPEHVFEFANDSYMRLIGHRDVLGKTVREALPEIEGQGFFELMDAVFATGQPEVAMGRPALVARSIGAAPDEVWLDFVYAATRDGAGEIDGIFVEGYEVTGRVLADEQNALLTGELHHRVKNNLATVISLAEMSGKTAQNVPDFVVAFTGRVHAMAKTHDLLLGSRSKVLSVRDILLVELAPYIGEGEQVSLDCDEIAVVPSVSRSLGLIVHELLTNAAKYGALKTPEGRLAVRCGPATDGMVLEWREEAGRAIAPIGLKGFGTNLILTLARDLGGEARIEFRADGLDVSVTFRRDSSGEDFGAGALEAKVPPVQPASDVAVGWIAAIAERQDRESFVRLFDRYAPKMKAYLLNGGLTSDRAEAVLQDAMVQVWRRASEFERQTTAVPVWLFRIMRDLKVKHMA